MHGHPQENVVHYPPDRRFRVGFRGPAPWLVLALLVLPIVAAWSQFLAAGLPAISPPAAGAAGSEPAAPGFPGWVRLTHFVNLLFLVLLARSGVSILMDHPRLYWNDHCTPGTEWVRFTPLDVPKGRRWTAKDDARYVSPWFGLPGYRHTIGVARHWHLLSALFWLANGVTFVVLLLVTDRWRRLVPTSLSILPEAWNHFVHYVTFHMPPEPDTFFRYNALQQLSYFAVVFVMAPLSVLTGMAMSPAIVNRFGWYPRLFGGRQAARSIHFLLLLGYVGFLVVHVTMVAATGFVRNMNHVVLGTDDEGTLGAILGLAGIAMVIAACFLAHFASWRHPRVLQKLVRAVHLGFMRKLFFRFVSPRMQYAKAEISPYLWPNGTVPTSAEWEALAADDFAGFRLAVGGLVENPVELSLADLEALGKQQQITMHHCIQGWSGIAEWGGLPMRTLVAHVKPKPNAKVVVFHSFGEGLYGGPYYDTQKLENVLLEQCILAWEMNYEPLGRSYGAPLRLRVENQLGYKMVKWIKSIEFVASETLVGKGHGGKNEDDEYFDLTPEI